MRKRSQGEYTGRGRGRMMGTQRRGRIRRVREATARSSTRSPAPEGYGSSEGNGPEHASPPDSTIPGGDGKRLLLIDGPSTLPDPAGEARPVRVACPRLDCPLRCTRPYLSTIAMMAFR